MIVGLWNRACGYLSHEPFDGGIPFPHQARRVIWKAIAFEPLFSPSQCGNEGSQVTRASPPLPAQGRAMTKAGLPAPGCLRQTRHSSADPLTFFGSRLRCERVGRVLESPFCRTRKVGGLFQIIGKDCRAERPWFVGMRRDYVVDSGMVGRTA